MKGGRCEACEGDGSKLVEMHFLADVLVPCDVCHGKRFNDATLRVHVQGTEHRGGPDLSVREAMDSSPTTRRLCESSRRSTTWASATSGSGRAPYPLGRRGAAHQVGSRALPGPPGNAVLLDEPTTGLHFDDIRKLLVVLNRLVDAGNTVLVIEHNLDVIKCADHVIDLGPEGGEGGGRLLRDRLPGGGGGGGSQLHRSIPQAGPG